MKMQTAGKSGNPVIIMLPGSFCTSSSLEYLYGTLKDEYEILLPEYGGHYEGSTFTTREKEVEQIAAYLKEQKITRVRMIYGQSMGAEVGIELLRQLLENNISVDQCFFDGAPCIKLPGFYKKFMYLKFKTMLSIIKKKDVEEILQSRLLKKAAHGDTESLRPMIEALSQNIPKCITKESIKKETECCYTFDFPAFDEKMQKRMHFFYASAEKAYKACFPWVKKAYPAADYKVEKGYGHLTYSIQNTEHYIRMVRSYL